MGMILAILAFILIGGVVWWCTTRLMAAFGLPDPLATVIQVVVILLLLVAFLDMTGILGGNTLHIGRL